MSERSAHEWAWRERLRANPHAARIYRVAVGIVGALVVTLGLVLVPFPGPGWLIVFIGLGILASEFEWAQSLLHWVRAKVEAWWDWIEARGWWAKLLAGLGTFIIVCAVLWGLFSISGVPSWFPDVIADGIKRLPGVE